MSIITPPPYGRPDYSTALTWDGGLVIDYSGQPAPAQFFGPFACTSWRGVLLNMRNIAPGPLEGARLALSWSNDRNGTVAVVRRDMATYGQGAQWEGVVLANYGTWLNVTLQSETVTAPTIALTLQQTNRVLDSTGTMVDPQAGLFTNEAVNAGASQSLAPPHMFNGPSVVSVISNQALSWTFDTVSDGGLGFVSFPLPALAANQQQTFTWNMPLTQWRFTFTNSLAVGALVNLYIQPEDQVI